MPAPTPERATRAMRILHGGMLLILVGFGAGAWVYLDGLEPAADEPVASFESVQVIFYMLAAISVGMIAMVPVIRARMMPVFPPGLRIAPGTPAMDRALGTVLGKWGNANMVSWALAMSVGLYGVVLVAMLKQIWPFAVFGSAAALVLAYYRPRLAEARALAARLANADTE